MNLPVASCLVCGQEKELAVWVDPAITNGSFHGVCFQCRQAAQQPLAHGQASPSASDRCLHGYLICDDPSCWRPTPAGKA